MMRSAFWQIILDKHLLLYFFTSNCWDLAILKKLTLKLVEVQLKYNHFTECFKKQGRALKGTKISSLVKNYKKNMEVNPYTLYSTVDSRYLEVKGTL